VLPTSVSKFRTAFVAKLEAERSKLTALSHEFFAHLFDEFIEVEKRLVYYDEKFTAMGQHHPECQRLLTVPGIGPLTATALVAAVSDAKQLHNGRQFAAWPLPHYGAFQHVDQPMRIVPVHRL
jgi:transposase